jgi:hypothetical protein
VGFLENRKAEIRFFHNLDDSRKLKSKQIKEEPYEII